MDLLASTPRSKVADFYTGRNIFITGATGFVGKVLIHKLLTACPGIGSIYMLIRPKRGQEPSARLKDLLAGPIFASVPEEKLKKLCALEGDITSPKLGLSREDEHTLTTEVSVIFHSAATVKFDEDLSKSLAMNVEVRHFEILLYLTLDCVICRNIFGNFVLEGHN